MNEVTDFLKENPLQFCATIGLDGKPKVRPFQMMYNEGDKLVFCTGGKKVICRELAANPYVEICASNMEKWLRISGRVEWINGREAKEKVIASSELVASIYKTADNPDLRVFYIADATAVISDFSGNPPRTYVLGN